jgi:antitoxin FitA
VSAVCGIRLLPRVVPAMTSITIPLSDERVAQLRIWAEEAGLPPEEFLRRRVEQLLDRPDQQFQKAVDHLLQKNAELYRRLA